MSVVERSAVVDAVVRLGFKQFLGWLVSRQEERMLRVLFVPRYRPWISVNCAEKSWTCVVRTPARYTKSSICNKMPISKRAILFLVFVLMFSVFVASISNLISVGESTPKISSDRQNEDIDPNTDSRVNNVTLGKAPDHLIWFIQVCTVK